MRQQAEHCAQVGVHAVMRLLAAGGGGNSSFYSKEVAGGDDAVVAKLTQFRGEEPEEQAKCVLGLELLARFIAVQDTSECAKSIGVDVLSTCGPAAPVCLARRRRHAAAPLRLSPCAAALSPARC
jgi:hypothetical protein